MDFANNLLEEALQIIPASVFRLQKFIGNTTNERGLDIAEYAAPVEVRGSVQDMDGSLYQELGLDLSKNYRTFYGSKLMEGLGRNIQAMPDRIIYDGKIWEVVNAAHWYGYNGWTYVIGVETGVYNDT